MYSAYQGKRPHVWVTQCFLGGKCDLRVTELESVPKMPNPSLPKI